VRTSGSYESSSPSSSSNPNDASLSSGGSDRYDCSVVCAARVSKVSIASNERFASVVRSVEMSPMLIVI